MIDDIQEICSVCGQDVDCDGHEGKKPCPECVCGKCYKPAPVICQCGEEFMDFPFCKHKCRKI